MPFRISFHTGVEGMVVQYAGEKLDGSVGNDTFVVVVDDHV